MSRVAKRKWSKRVEQPDGTFKTVTGKTSKYYGYVTPTKRIPLASDKTASERMLADINRRRERGAAGIIDPKQQAKPIVLHVADYLDSRAGRSESRGWSETVKHRIETVAHECGWSTLRSITLDSIETWAAKARAAGKGAASINRYVGAVGTFCRWAVRRGRLEIDPIDGFERLNEQDDVRRIRRALTLDEIGRLLAAALEAARDGVRRRLVYLVALFTGLRRSELAALEWGDVRIDNTPAPFIQLRAAATKAKRADAIPIRTDIADALREARPLDHQDGDRVFKAIPTLRTFKLDLAAAGIPYRDAEGRQADFHALRHTFCTMLAVVGVPQRHAQGLMRHTTAALTNQTYTDEALLPLREAVERLPAIVVEPKPESEPATAAATGTHDAEPDANRPLLAGNWQVDRSHGGPQWHNPTTGVGMRNDASDARKPNRIGALEALEAVVDQRPRQESNLQPLASEASALSN